MAANTLGKTECSNCYELESTECIVEEQSITSLELPAGSRLNLILRNLDLRIKDFISKFKKVIYNVKPIFDTGVTIANYTAKSCGTGLLDLNVPLFLNGRECFEYEVDNTVTYSNESAYLLFFNHTRSGGVILEDNDTIKITKISGVVLGTPIIVKNPGETTFTFNNTLLQTLLSAVNSTTTSTFTDLVTDSVYTINEDVGLGLVPSANASAAFLADLTFEYDILDVSLTLKETVIENITSLNTSGVGITNITIENIFVSASMGVLTFFDNTGAEITDVNEINSLINIIVEGNVTAVCCPDCSTDISIVGEGATLTTAVTSFEFKGEGVTVTNVGGDVTVTITTVPFKEVKIPISEADILALHNTDKELLPPSPLFGYDVHSIIIRGIQGTTDYVYTVPNDDYQVQAKVVGVTTNAAGETLFTISDFLETLNATVIAGVTVPSTKMVEFHTNPLWTTNSEHGVYLSTMIPGEVYTTGDHTMVAIVTYKEIPVI